MAVILEKIYEAALRSYQMKLLAGKTGLFRLVDWVHVVEEIDYTGFLKGRELIVTTGIKEPDENQLLEFTHKIYEAEASGLVINIGKYIPKVPECVLQFCRKMDFPVFELPWEVHLVDFNRELCNLIYRTEREYDSLDSVVQKVIFSPENLQECLPVFHQGGIERETPLCLIQGYFPLTEQKHGIKTEEEGIFDVTQFYYNFHCHCQQMLSRIGKKYVIFRSDAFVTIVIFEPAEEDVTRAIKGIRQFPATEEAPVHSSIAISETGTQIDQLSQKYKSMSLLCRQNIRENRSVCREEDMGVWRLLLDVTDRECLRKYKEQVLGQLEHVDIETGSEYGKILECYLKENGNIQEVASRCFLHRNTITYQLKKIAEITKRNLNNAADRNELYLAFQIRNMLEL